jgi:hypothetical protein
VADALAPELAILTAVTVTGTAEIGAVNNPVLDIVPPVVVQMTPTLLVPLIVAVNWRLAPGEICALVGETCTRTFDWEPCELFAGELAPETDEQELVKRAVESKTSVTTSSCFVTWRLSWRSLAKGLRPSYRDIKYLSSERNWGLAFEPCSHSKVIPACPLITEGLVSFNPGGTSPRNESAGNVLDWQLRGAGRKTAMIDSRSCCKRGATGDETYLEFEPRRAQFADRTEARRWLT